MNKYHFFLPQCPFQRTVIMRLSLQDSFLNSHSLLYVFPLDPHTRSMPNEQAAPEQAHTVLSFRAWQIEKGRIDLQS